jgi:hypothetical protein
LSVDQPDGQALPPGLSKMKRGSLQDASGTVLSMDCFIAELAQRRIKIPAIDRRKGVTKTSIGPERNCTDWTVESHDRSKSTANRDGSDAAFDRVACLAGVL